MQPQFTRISRVGVPAITLTLTSVLLLTCGRPSMAQPAQGTTIQGTWGVQVTLRDCATTAPLGPSLSALVTFHQGGSISESPGGRAFAPGQRSSGHGVWTHLSGVTYSQRMVALILFDTAPNPPVSPGFQAGWQIVAHTVTLSDADHFTSAGSNQFYDVNRQLYRTGCSTAVGERFK